MSSMFYSEKYQLYPFPTFIISNTIFVYLVSCIFYVVYVFCVMLYTLYMLCYIFLVYVNMYEWEWMCIFTSFSNISIYNIDLLSIHILIYVILIFYKYFSFSVISDCVDYDSNLGLLRPILSKHFIYMGSVILFLFFLLCDFLNILFLYIYYSY